MNDHDINSYCNKLDKILTELLISRLSEPLSAQILAELWLKINDPIIKIALTTYTPNLLSNFQDINELSKLWFSTTSQELRNFIALRLKELSSIKPELIIKLSIIFQNSK